MRSIKERKSSLLNMLESTVDKHMLEWEFKRRKNSFIYKRNFSESTQSIEFIIHYSPKYGKEAEVHIYPFFTWMIPVVTEKSLQLVDGDKRLLLNAPEIIIKQPLDVFVSNEHSEYWLPKTIEDYPLIGSNISLFIDKWVIDSLNSLKSVDDFLAAYEKKHPKLLMSKSLFVHVIAAYLIKDEHEKAKLVLEEHLSGLGLKRRYSVLHDKF